MRKNSRKVTEENGGREKGGKGVTSIKGDKGRESKAMECIKGRETRGRIERTERQRATDISGC